MRREHPHGINRTEPRPAKKLPPKKHGSQRIEKHDVRESDEVNGEGEEDDGHEGDANDLVS